MGMILFLEGGENDFYFSIYEWDEYKIRSILKHKMIDIEYSKLIGSQIHFNIN